MHIASQANHQKENGFGPRHRDGSIVAGGIDSDVVNFDDVSL